MITFMTLRLADHRTFGAAGNKSSSASGFHAIQCHRSAVYRVRGATLGNRENPLAKGATDLMADASHWLTIQVCLGESLKYHSTMTGGVTQSDDVFHGLSSSLYLKLLQSHPLNAVAPNIKTTQITLGANILVVKLDPTLTLRHFYMKYCFLGSAICKKNTFQS